MWNPAGKKAARPRWMLFMVIVGYFVPCLIGIAVWLHLRLVGKPVMPFDWVLSAIPILCIFSAIWVLPFLAVFIAARYLNFEQKKSAGLIYGAFLGTLVSEIVVFGIAWANVEIVFMGVLFLPVLVFVGTLVGGAIGLLCGWMLLVKTP
jgi:hypothetical protein